MQTVAVQSGLDNLGELLSNQGYQVVPLEKGQNFVDAIVYSCFGCELEGLSDLSSFEKPGSALDYINVFGMAPEEAVDLVDFRLGKRESFSLE